jgi:hypothetical protein
MCGYNAAAYAYNGERFIDRFESNAAITPQCQQILHDRRGTPQNSQRHRFSGEWHLEGDAIHLKVSAYRTTNGTDIDEKSWRLVWGQDGPASQTC